VTDAKKQREKQIIDEAQADVSSSESALINMLQTTPKPKTKSSK
jgi:hypothetical protein